MAPRASMEAILGHIRLLIGDPAGDVDVFGDDELQVFADGRRTDVYYQPLAPLPTVAPGGSVALLEWVSARGWWEGDTVVVDGGYAALTPASADLQRGRWTFGESQSAVLVRGAWYDVHGAAADAVEAWMARVKMEFDFEADGAGYKRSQKIAGLQALLVRLRRQSVGGVRTVRMVRGDNA